MTTMTVTIEDYRPSPRLDAELADLGYAAVHGWPDQSPVDARLVRSLLRPGGMTATTLALHRGAEGTLRAAAALRWPATLDAFGRLWGPIVHPDARGNGLGRALMAAITDVMANHPGVTLSTTFIPESRTAGWSMFVRAGWQDTCASSLLERSLPASMSEPVSVAQPAPVVVRAVQPGEYVAPTLSDLFASCRPELGPTMARDTFARWSGDARYTPDGLLLAECDGALIGAAIVFPSAPGRPDEPAEALIDDVMTLRSLDPETAVQVRAALVEAALRAGAAKGAAVARAVADDPELIATLTGAGFEVLDQVRRFTYQAARLG